MTFTARRGCYLPSGRYSKAKVCRAPSASAYRNAFGMFDAKFPWVKTYSAWNEINHKSQPTFKSPRTAAGYYNVLRAEARKGKFRVMAADVLDTPDMSRYLASFRRHAKGIAEAVGPAQLRRRQPPPHDLHQADAAHRPRRGLADRDRRHRQAAAELQALAESRAAARTKGLFRLVDNYDTRRRGMRSKIARLFVYSFYGAEPSARFDAGLVNPDGAPRKACSVFRKNARKHR